MISISGVGTTARSPKAGHSALDAGSERRPIFESRKNQRLPLRSLRCDVNILLAKSFYHFALLHRFGQSASEPSEGEDIRAPSNPNSNYSKRLGQGTILN
ncbi:hypothetical protein ACFX2J_020373 [Malus domestica]